MNVCSTGKCKETVAASIVTVRTIEPCTIRICRIWLASVCFNRISNCALSGSASLCRIRLASLCFNRICHCALSGSESFCRIQFCVIVPGRKLVVVAPDPWLHYFTLSKSASNCNQVFEDFQKGVEDTHYLHFRGIEINNEWKLRSGHRIVLSLWIFSLCEGIKRATWSLPEPVPHELNNKNVASETAWSCKILLGLCHWTRSLFWLITVHLFCTTVGTNCFCTETRVVDIVSQSLKFDNYFIYLSRFHYAFIMFYRVQKFAYTYSVPKGLAPVSNQP
jgi:hypothetical protein